MQHVPYKGGSPAMADLAAGHIPAVSAALSTAAGHIRAGKVRALVVSSVARHPNYPNVPTFAELGYKNMVVLIWLGLSGPAGMPQDIVERLNAEVRKALDAPDMRQRLASLDIIELDKLSARESAAFIESEVKRWAPVAKALQ